MTDQEATYRDALFEFIRDHLAQDPAQVVKHDQPLVSAGIIDSFSLVELSVFIEESLGVTVPDPEMTVRNFDSVALGAATVCRIAAEG